MKRSTYFSRILPATLALTAFSCAVSVTLLTAGCGGGGSDTGARSEATRSNGSVTMTIKWPRLENTRKIPLATRSITVAITGTGGSQTRTITRPTDGAPSTVTFSNLPIRGDYTLTGTAFASTDGSGVALARAGTTVRFTLTQPSQTATLNLDTTIVRLEVSPRPVALSITGAGRTLNLSASGYDAATGGNMVPVASVNFSVADPGIATLSPPDPVSGIVTITAVAEGATTLTATDPETGIATTVDVTVGRFATKIWTVQLQGEIKTGAAVSATGNVYVGDDLERLHGFTPAGASLTGFPANLSGSNRSAVSQPIFIAPNVVFALDNAGGGFAFDATTGAPISSVDTGTYAVEDTNTEIRVINKPAVTPSGVIYAGTKAGTLSKATPTGAGAGFTVVQIPVATGEIVSAPSIAPTGSNVFVTSSTLSSLSAKFHAFRPDNTRLFPAVPLDGQVAIGTAISSDGSRVYAATGMGAGGVAKVYGINATSGAILWTRTLPNAFQVSGAPVVGPDGTVYIGTWGSDVDSNEIGGQVFALDGASGTVKPGWPFEVPFSPDTVTFRYSDIDSSVAVAPDGTVYAASVNGMLYAIRSDGVKLYEVTVSTTDAVIATPAVGPDGTVYVGARDGFFSAFR